MNTTALGTIIYVVLTMLLVIPVFEVLRRARKKNIQGIALLRQLAPFLIADVLLTIVFIVWFVSRLPH
ncbi:MAG: hypothetical protein U5L04_04350 [Trueperaceae bacterium]|nr:hypothetical protein [Trueperaceae bacterium]